METIADMPVPAFNALAALNIYFFADLAWPSARTPRQRRRHLRTLHAHGYLTKCHEVEDSSHDVATTYEDAIEAHVENELPDGWEPTHDHWGACCIAYRPGWRAPQHNTFFAGDSSGRYMTFENADALQEYTERSLSEIEGTTEQREQFA